jgi:hypothetical protein
MYKRKGFLIDYVSLLCMSENCNLGRCSMLCSFTYIDDILCKKCWYLTEVTKVSLMKQVAQKNEVNWNYIGQARSTYSPAETNGLTQYFKPFSATAEIKQ